MKRLCKQSILMFLILTVITGLLYPAVITLIGQTAFSYQANGSIISENGKLVGSELIGQNFTKPEYFWGRLSATSPAPYNSASSCGSNLGPTNPALVQVVKQQIAVLRSADSTNTKPVPVDLVTASGSGLDPHISLAAAEYQLQRVANCRHVSDGDIRTVLNRYTEQRQYGILGEMRVNVLDLNRALDKRFPVSQ